MLTKAARPDQVFETIARGLGEIAWIRVRGEKR